MDMLHKYLKNLEMIISGEKTPGDTWFIKDHEIMIEDNPIPPVDPDEAFRYLGVKMGPWRVIHCGIVVPEILSVMRRVRKLSLKPCQKIKFITNYPFLRFIYNLLINPPSDDVLKLLYSEVRQEIKAILHLVPSTTTDFFYTSKVNEGLELPRFKHIVELSKAIPIVDMEAAIVASVILSAWIVRFGVPLKITTDQLRQFESNLFQRIMPISRHQAFTHDGLSSSV